LIHPAIGAQTKIVTMIAATNVGLSSAPTSRGLSGTTACLPIVYGSIAYFLGKKADELQTHEWTLFLRGPNHEDLSPVISKVTFQLHQSFAQPTRELTTPPYRVTERGWGEFEAQIHIHWTDTTEMTTIINHTIKLYPPGSPPNVMPTDTETPVLAETYDEVVFTDPSESFFRALTQVPTLPKVDPFMQDDDNDDDDEQEGKEEEERSGSNKQANRQSHAQYMTTIYSDQEDFLTLIAAQKFLQDELSKVKRRFQIVNEEIVAVDQKMITIQQQKQREDAVAAASNPPTIPAQATTIVPKSTRPASSSSAPVTALSTKTTTSGKNAKKPSSQRKSRPGSQTKRAKTATSGTSSETKSTVTTTMATSAPSIGKSVLKK
jgi:YEATS domain-containing protein 4